MTTTAKVITVDTTVYTPHAVYDPSTKTSYVVVSDNAGGVVIGPSFKSIKPAREWADTMPQVLLATLFHNE